MDVAKSELRPGAQRRRERVMLWTSRLASLVAWTLANGLDVLSVLVVVRAGGRMAWVRYHPAEWFLVYAGLRFLGTLALALVVLSVSRRWPSASRPMWWALTVCALATVAAAWWRLHS
jgi:hypothetical protein